MSLLTQVVRLQVEMETDSRFVLYKHLDPAMNDDALLHAYVGFLAQTPYNEVKAISQDFERIKVLAVTLRLMK